MSYDRGVQDFHGLKVWQKAHALTLAVYIATSDFPREEQYGLTSQIRRACSSVPANIAEGCGRDGDVEFSRFCRIAMGSACELDYHLLLAKDLKLLKEKEYAALWQSLNELKKMLSSLQRRLKAESLKLIA